LLAGTLVTSPALQASLWAIDSVGLVVATSLLALRYFRVGVDIVAALMETEAVDAPLTRERTDPALTERQKRAYYERLKREDGDA